MDDKFPEHTRNMCRIFRDDDARSALHWSWPGITLDFPSPIPYVVGVLNLTPDSFSDGGLYASREAAVAAAIHMVADGASVIDIGGMSTRPGFTPVSLGEEESRVLPVLADLQEALAEGGRKALVSLDTDKPALAEQALRQGLVHMINDVSGGDEAMASVAAAYGAPLILMHRPVGGGRGAVAAVIEDLAAVCRQYIEAGMRQDQIAIDPGLGFGKTAEENLSALRDCSQLLALGCPLYIGASRKRFIGRYSGSPEAAKRLGGSLASALWASASGASFVRVHDVRETVEALHMWSALGRSKT